MAPSLKPVLSMDELSPISCAGTTTTSLSLSLSLSSSSLEDPKIKSNMQYVFQQLGDDEIELAACASYEYQNWKKQNYSPQDDRMDVLLLTTKRNMYAMEMIERYVLSKSDPTIALQRLKETLQFRKKMNLHQLDDYTEQHKEELASFFKDQKAYVQGYDASGRSTILFIPRYVTDHHLYDRTIIGHLWNMEKAVACTKSYDKTFNVVVDMSQFSIYHHSPPYRIGRELLTILRKHYVGHVHKIFIINAPTTFSIIWNLFSPFLGTKTKNKIVFVNHNDLDNMFYQYYHPTQATSWMIPTFGHKNRSLNANEYIHKVPFHQAYDE